VCKIKWKGIKEERKRVWRTEEKTRERERRIEKIVLMDRHEVYNICISSVSERENQINEIEQILKYIKKTLLNVAKYFNHLVGKVHPS
jgi:hypothetical protein